MENLYSHRSQFVLGFHGCDKALAEDVVLGKKMLKESDHDYDWLGHGIYFWENNVERAEQWADANSKRKGSMISTPEVLGAFLDLGNCLDLTDSGSLQQLKLPYETLKKTLFLAGLDMPVNVDPVRVKSKDRILRKLDCAVISTLHKLRQNAGLPPYDSVRGVFGRVTNCIQGQDLEKRIIFKSLLSILTASKVSFSHVAWIVSILFHKSV